MRFEGYTTFSDTAIFLHPKVPYDVSFLKGIENQKSLQVKTSIGKTLSYLGLPSNGTYMAYGARRIATNSSNFGPKVPLERRSCDECYPTPPFGAKKLGPNWGIIPKRGWPWLKKVWLNISKTSYPRVSHFYYLYIFVLCF